MRVARAGGHIPVDGPRVITGLVLADLIEGHPPSLKDGMVVSGHLLTDKAPSDDLDASDFSEQFSG